MSRRRNNGERRVVCAWCKGTISGTGEGAVDSHGICKTCNAAQIEIARKARATSRRRHEQQDDGTGMRPNPFLARPEGKHHGQPAGGSRQLPGFHTASMLDQALPYAHQKGGADEATRPEGECPVCEDEVCAECAGLYRIPDYPVIVEVDMSGLEPAHDVDARWLLKQGGLVDFAREALESGDPVGWLESPGDSQVDGTNTNVEIALFESFAAHETEPAQVLHNYVVDMPPEEAIATLRTVAAGGRSALEVAMRAIGQYRYAQDVPVDRVVAVHYVRPFWPTVLDTERDEETEQLASALEDAGWDVVGVDDLGQIQATAREVWRRPEPEGARIEYHGTGYRNLLLAAPELAGVLPVPPIPYEAAS